jgi:hypothetical protein
MPLFLHDGLSNAVEVPADPARYPIYALYVPESGVMHSPALSYSQFRARVFAPSTSVVGLGSLACATGVLHAAVAVATHHVAAGATAAAAVEYYAAVVALVAAYVAVLEQVGGSPSRRTWWMLAAVPLAIQIGWLVSMPVLAIDAYSYLVDAARIDAGLNPYEHAVLTAGNTRLGQELAHYGWRPVHGVSPYGPVWMHVAGTFIGPVATDVEVGARVVKLIALAATGVAAYLISLIAPAAHRARAFTLFWWNPAVIIEGAGEGHNDALMVAAVLLSLWALRARAPVSAAAALTVAVLMKWVPAMFAPIYLAYVWRAGMLTARTIALGGATVAGIVVAAAWPFWAGGEMLSGVRRIGYPRSVASSTGVIRTLLPTSILTDRLLRVAAASVIGVTVLRGARSASTFDAVVRACATAAVIYMLVSSPVYWAWYVLLPIALLALTGDVALVCALTIASRLVAPLNLMRLEGALDRPTEVWLSTIVGLWIPLAFVIWRTLRRDRRESARHVAS